MPYASFNNHGTEERPINNAVNEAGFNQSKAIAKVYGYMGIGLLITAVVCFFTSWLFHEPIQKYVDLHQLDFARPWVFALFASWIVSAIAILVLSFVIPVKAARGKSSLWVPYILYAIFMGILLSAVLLAGIEFYIVGEAFAITTLAFTGMFLIGWFSKKDLSIVGYIAFSLLWGILLIGLVGFITFAIRGFTADQVFWFDIGIQAAIIVVLLLITMVDTWRIKKILMNSGEATNMYLYAAYVMYTDFISLLLRILYILARTSRR